MKRYNVDLKECDDGEWMHIDDVRKLVNVDRKPVPITAYAVYDRREQDLGRTTHCRVVVTVAELRWAGHATLHCLNSAGYWKVGSDWLCPELKQSVAVNPKIPLAHLIESACCAAIVAHSSSGLI